MTKKQTLAELMREEREKKQNQPIVVEEQIVPEPKEVPVVIQTDESLKSFLKTLSETKKRQKQELKEKSVVVLPKLGDFFSLLSETKKQVSVIQTQVENVSTENIPNPEPVIEKKEEVIELVNELRTTIEELEQKQEDIEHSIDDSADLKTQLEAVKTSIAALEKRINKELATLQKTFTKTVIMGGSGGGGEVRFDRLDDVSILNLQDGDAVVYNATTKRFINVPIRLSGGTTNQVLVKLSENDYDYEWQDMNISNPTYTKLIDDSSVASVTFIGEAVPTSLESSPVWRIQKIQFDSSGNVDSVKFASTGAFDQIWLNRISLTYS